MNPVAPVSPLLTQLTQLVPMATVTLSVATVLLIVAAVMLLAGRRLLGAFFLVAFGVYAGPGVVRIVRGIIEAGMGAVASVNF